MFVEGPKVETLLESLDKDSKTFLSKIISDNFSL